MKKWNLAFLSILLFSSQVHAANCTKIVPASVEVLDQIPVIVAGTTDAVIGNFYMTMGTDTNCDFTIHEVEFQIYGPSNAVASMTNFRLYDENGVQFGKMVPDDANHGHFDHKIKFKDWGVGLYIPTTDLVHFVLKADIQTDLSTNAQIKAVLSEMYTSYVVPTGHIYLREPGPAYPRILKKL